MKYRMSIVLLIVALALVSYVYTNPGSEQPIADNGEKENISMSAEGASVVGRVTIEMDETGFSSDAITIKKNTEVLFKNTGSQAHWPASNVHPTHGIYPEFDPQRPIPPGESWTFVFTKVGNWRMHDHLISRIAGTIVVTE
jgi:plastocyanin